MMRSKIILLFLGLSLGLSAQSLRKKVEAGNQSYAEGAYDKAEISYREALKEGEKHRSTLNYNLGDALYKQERFEEARKAFQASLAEAETEAELAEAHHNLANSYLKENKLKEAIDHYKKSLINNPSDEETRYNLAKALEQQKQQQEQQKQDQNQDQDQEKNQEKEKDQDQKQDQDQKEDQNQEKQNPNQDQSDSKDPKDQEKGQPQKPDIDRQNAERLLEALDRDEEKLQKELLKKRMKKSPNKSVKDW